MRMYDISEIACFKRKQVKGDGARKSTHISYFVVPSEMTREMGEMSEQINQVHPKTSLFVYFCVVCVCGPTIWNKLPQDLRSADTGEQFKRRLAV